MNVHRRTALKGMLGTSAVVKTYPDASQFWTYDPDEFLKHPSFLAHASEDLAEPEIDKNHPKGVTA